jgi:hypothetical protein
MVQQVVSKVPFVLGVVGKCLCPGCPVQAKSQCVSGLKNSLSQALSQQPLKREQIPGAYCASGKATCGDLDPKQKCLCGDCAVFAEYKLANGQPVGYYCRDGAAR